jgi:hypothetical protein
VIGPQFPRFSSKNCRNVISSSAPVHCWGRIFSSFRAAIGAAVGGGEATVVEFFRSGAIVLMGLTVIGAGVFVVFYG